MTAEPLALATLVAVVFVKEAGVPVPVPGDILVIGAGVAAGQGSLDPGVTLVALVLASIVGGTLQYALLRSAARPLLLRVLRRFGIGEDRVDRIGERLRGAGARGVAVARATPGVRVVTIAASALATVPPAAFVAGLSAGNALFIAAHFGLGVVVGEPVLAIAGRALGLVAAIGLGLVLLGAAGWIVVARRRLPGGAVDSAAKRGTVRARHGPPPPAIGIVLAWADAACPACLVVAAIDRTPA